MGDKERTALRHRPLMELATRQHGVVSTRQLAECGYSRNSASKANKVARLRRIYRGVYAVGHRRLTWEGWCMASVLAASPAVASHWSAAWLWGLLRSRPARNHVTTPTRRSARRPYAVHFAVLPERDLTELDSIPATSLARTLLDIASGCRPRQLEGSLERVDGRGLLDFRDVDELLVRAGSHPGRGALRRAMEVYRPDPELTRSGVERLFRDLVRKAGLPRPAMNFNVAGYELDAYWPELRFCVELDVFETHGSRASFESDRRRQEELKLIGVEMVRFTGPRLKREPKAIAGRVATLLRRRREELHP